MSQYSRITDGDMSAPARMPPSRVATLPGMTIMPALKRPEPARPPVPARPPAPVVVPSRPPAPVVVSRPPLGGPTVPPLAPGGPYPETAITPLAPPRAARLPAKTTLASASQPPPAPHTITTAHCSSKKPPPNAYMLNLPYAERKRLEEKLAALPLMPALPLLNPDNAELYQYFQDDADFTSLGIGGLNTELRTFFRDALLSRILPKDVAASLDVKHVRGVLLYGPPGCGKTHIARTVSKMVSHVSPVLINGPEILASLVGESQKNLREAFDVARVDTSDHLHVICIDEIDSIAGHRGGPKCA